MSKSNISKTSSQDINRYGDSKNFLHEIQFLNKVLACEKGEIPAEITKVVANYCLALEKNIEKNVNRYIKESVSFFEKLHPPNLPPVVVYPFGGFDLFSALVTFSKKATEITTISLENSGDPRSLSNLKPGDLENALRSHLPNVSYILRTKNMSHPNSLASEGGVVPPQLSFSLIAARIFNYEPISLRYFSIHDDGSLHYYSLKEITELEKKRADKLKQGWVDTKFSIAFRHMEVEYREKGAPAAGHHFIHRHIAYNLDNKNLKNSPLEKHLLSKGPVAAMTKAASYLLWFGSFSGIRDYLLKNMVIMYSDATGILPHHAKAAGFEQITYGIFNSAFLDNGGGENAALMRQLFASQPRREMPFFYGHGDATGKNNLIITRPKSPGNKQP